MSLYIEVLLGFCSISHLLVLISPSQLTNSPSICITPHPSIGNLSNASCIILNKLFNLVCSCNVLSSILFKPTLILIGLDVVMFNDLVEVFVSFRVIILFPGVVKSKRQWLDLVQRPNTKPSPMLQQKLNGCMPFYVNLEFLSLVLLFYGVTTLEQPIFLQIQYSMLALSMLRLIFTLFEIWLLTVHFSFVFYLAVISLLTSLQSLYLPLDLLFFGPQPALAYKQERQSPKAPRKKKAP